MEASRAGGAAAQLCLLQCCPKGLSAVAEMSDTSHMWELSTSNVASTNKELNL